MNGNDLTAAALAYGAAAAEHTRLKERFESDREDRGADWTDYPAPVSAAKREADAAREALLKLARRMHREAQAASRPAAA